MRPWERRSPSPGEIRRALDVLKRADFRAIQESGYHFQANDFYSPLNDCSFLEANRDLWEPPFEPVEIRWDVDRQLEVAREVARFVGELGSIPDEAEDDRIFRWNNQFWNSADALVQYGLARSRRPARVVEIGCGWSSLLLARALARNEEEGAPRGEVDLIEPFPRREQLNGVPRHWRLHESILQRAPLSIFDALGANDVLFFDGSHCAKVASDVTWFFFRVLPRLASGVLVHLHDVFFPFSYPEAWIFERGQTWNEQFVLQAFLMHNDRFRVEICNSYLHWKRPEELRALYRDVQPPWGCSIWLVKL